MADLKAVLAAMVAASALSAGAALAQTDDSAVASANRSAYGWALKCFIADGHAEGIRSRAGDATQAKYYESKAHQSFDAGTKLGAVLGLSGSQIDEDFGRTQASELPPMVTDRQYFAKAVATCKALGLM